MVTSIDYTRGPFGDYGKHTPGHVLNALCHFGIPVNRVEHLRLGNNTLTDNGEIYAHVQYFPELEQPLFRFADPIIHGTKNDAGFQLTLSVSDAASFQIKGPWATRDVHEALAKGFNSRIQNANAQHVSVTAGAFFTTGSIRPSQKDFVVEFWKPAGAQAWMDLFNDRYKQILRNTVSEAYTLHSPL